MNYVLVAFCMQNNCDSTKKRKENQIKWKETNAFKEWTFVRTIQGFRLIFTQTNQPIDWPTNRQADIYVHTYDRFAKKNNWVFIHWLDAMRCDHFPFIPFGVFCRNLFAFRLVNGQWPVCIQLNFFSCACAFPFICLFICFVMLLPVNKSSYESLSLYFNVHAYSTHTHTSTTTITGDHLIW